VKGKLDVTNWNLGNTPRIFFNWELRNPLFGWLTYVLKMEALCLSKNCYSQCDRTEGHNTIFHLFVNVTFYHHYHQQHGISKFMHFSRSNFVWST
jgi:hypothetical protein